jgi:hypothetical protein
MRSVRKPLRFVSEAQEVCNAPARIRTNAEASSARLKERAGIFFLINRE